MERKALHLSYQIPTLAVARATGCGHACVYCYTTTYIPKAFSPRPKKYLLARLERDLKRMEIKKHVSISNSSDPYTPPENELGLTVDAFPSERENLWSLYWEQGEKVGGIRYLPLKLRRQLLSRVRDAVVGEVTFSVCREGFSEIDMGPTCDGSHLIPNRRPPH